MSSHPGQTTSGFNWLRVLIIFLIWAVVAAFSAPFILFVAPDIEVRLFPVIGEQRITNYRFKDETGRYALFEWRFQKYRYGRPEYFGFMMYDIRNPVDRYTTEAFSSYDCETSLRSLGGAPPGKEAVKEMCVRIPKQLIGNPWVVADGWVEYSVRHPFYTVGRRIPAEPEDWPIMAAGTTIRKPRQP